MEKESAYCVDCNAMTNQTPRFYFNDGCRYFKRTICGECGCENDLEIKPLTFTELFECDGLPVWAVLLNDTFENIEGWALVYKNSGAAAEQRWTNYTLWYHEYGKEWIAFKKQLIV